MFRERAYATLERLFQLFMCEGKWPTSLTLIRTQLLPKFELGNIVPTPGDWRPIAVISIWMRLWSKCQLAQLPPAFWAEFEECIAGGIPSRSSAPGILNILNQLEEAIEKHHSEEGFNYWGLLSLDASKCFDKIHQLGAMQTSLQYGIPQYTIQPLSAFLLQVERHFSAAGLYDVQALRPTNGLLQRDPLSVVICNILVSSWAKEISEASAEPFAYIDDRTIIAHQPSDLEKAWQASQMLRTFGKSMRRRPATLR